MCGKNKMGRRPQDKELKTMAKLNEIAKKTVAGNPIFENREKMTTDELISQYPQGVTITECALVHGDNDDYGVIAFAEKPTVFVSCGAIMTSIIVNWVKSVGTIDEVNASLLEEPVKVKMKKILNKKNQPLTVVDILA